MADETATLAAYVANLKFEDIPQEVLERAKVLTLDFLGSAIRARRDAESTPSLLKMLEALALDGSGESTVFGDSKTWTPAVAALLNGALGHSLDFDDTHADSSLHASAPVVPAAFAVGELVGASGREVLTAILREEGYGDRILHRTGHSLGETVHGTGVNMDDYETHDDRRLLPGTGFTIEPGVYFDDFGVRTEINMVVGPRDAGLRDHDPRRAVAQHERHALDPPLARVQSNRSGELPRESRG